MIKKIFLWLISIFVSHQLMAFDEVEVTPRFLYEWEAANVRDDALVEINNHQPLFGDGSLLFATNTQSSGQDKADFQLIWQQSTSDIDFPLRTISNITNLSYAWYRDAISSTNTHFIPVLRLNFYDDGGTPGANNTTDDVLGVLVWEGVYNGFQNPPNDSWQLVDITSQKYWAFVSFNPSGNTGVIQNYNATLNDWINGSVVGQNGDPIISLSADTLITGINVGVGSGWGGSFIGYVDAIRIAFGSEDDILFNFEACPTFVPSNNVDVIFEDDFECYKRF